MIKPETARRLMDAGFVSQPKSAGSWSPDLEDLLLEISRLGWDVSLIVTKESCRVAAIKKDDCIVIVGQKEEMTDLAGQMFLTLKSKTRKR